MWVLIYGGVSAWGAKPSPSPYEVGEKLTYHFYYGPFMVGRGTFEVTEQRKDGSFVFSVVVTSNEFISKLYPVSDEIVSVYDPVLKRSKSFEQNRSEGDSKVWEETFFFYTLGHGQTTSYVTGESKWFEIPKKGVQDKLSTIYYMRGLDWKDREKEVVIVGNDKKNHEVKIQKLGLETLTFDDFKSIPTFKVQPNTEYLGGFVKKGKMYVWVSDDLHRIPVKVLAELPIGNVTAVLVAVKGVKGWGYHKE